MIRKQLMRRYQLKRDGISKLKGKMCPRIVEKLGLKGRCGLCKVVGHNTRTYPKKKEKASNYRQPVTEVYLPTPPGASLPTPPTPSVSFTKQCVYIIFDVLFDLQLHYLMFYLMCY
jgi:hypothetical protein